MTISKELKDSVNLGVQYYRAPFPDQKYWEDDLRKIRQSGFNTIQFWISWGWVEATPDKFVYDDYDRLIELAAKNNLGIVLSTIAEIQPNWICRLIPGSEMIDHFGHKVISSTRTEHHFGITPGGCTDHPEVWNRMSRFISETGRRYAGLDNLRGWDIWNELRWNVQADGLVCFCLHTINKFHDWLKKKYGSLDGLNDAWKRRYCSWEDVIPGKLPQRPYTEMMAFEEFLTNRSNEHARMRFDTMREIDKIHLITAHGSDPCILSSGHPGDYPMVRGNDWALASALDGIGCSSFPQWAGIDETDFGLRVEMVKSAACGKHVWLSEVQGGRANSGFNIYGEVHSDLQQHWLWNGLARGADTVLFWCWRDEVFGHESGGFGISGRDGLAEERLAAMKISGGLLEKYAVLFKHYIPCKAEVGLLFTPRSYYLAWAQEGTANRIEHGLAGYMRALAKYSIPIELVESDHMEKLDKLKVLFLPRAIVLDSEQETAIRAFVENGGTLLAESECSAFDSHGFYRCPEERLLAGFGIVEQGRRTADKPSAQVIFKNKSYEIGVSQWLTPPEGVGEGDISTVRSFGSGKVVYLGSYPGNAYCEKHSTGFEDLLENIVSDAGVKWPVKVILQETESEKFVYVKSGKSDASTLLFVFFPQEVKEARLSISAELFPDGNVFEILSGQKLKTVAMGNSGYTLELIVKPGLFQIAVCTGGCEHNNRIYGRTCLGASVANVDEELSRT